MEPLLSEENLNTVCTDVKETSGFICFGPEESVVRYGKFTSMIQVLNKDTKFGVHGVWMTMESLWGENLNTVCTDLWETSGFICFGPEESTVRYGKFTSMIQVLNKYMKLGVHGVWMTMEPLLWGENVNTVCTDLKETYLQVHMFWPRRIHGKVRQIYVSLKRRGEFNLRLLSSLLQTLHGHRVFRYVNSLL